MGTRAVRLDDEAEKALAEVRRATGMTISEALKKGLLALRQQVATGRRPTAWTIYERIEIGPGGYGARSSGDTKRDVAEAIRRKHSR